jgi:aminopeptidase
VAVYGDELSRPLYIALAKQIWRSGGNVIFNYNLSSKSPADNLDKYFLQTANDQQIDFFAKDYLRGFVKQIDHRVVIICDANMQALKGVDPARIMRRSSVYKPYHEWLDKKENQGKYTWTLGIYGSPAMARAAGLSLEKYWQEIIKACYLDKPDPIACWKKIYAEIETISQKLNDLPIEWLRVIGPDMDLRLKIGSQRRWNGGGGRNVPSFEIFTSPDWRGTEGWAKFNQPLYIYGNLVEGIELKFKNGLVVESSASKNQKLLREMIATKGADRLGEFSLTDARFSRISKFMAEILYDENIGGRFGNTHVALGASFHDCFKGDPSKVGRAEWNKMGFNDSSVHTDIISTTNRTATATLADGSEVVIYKNGRFTV